jgi:hypothetical protein
MRIARLSPPPHRGKHGGTRLYPTEASSTDYPVGSAGKPLHSADAGSRRWDNEQFEQEKTKGRSSPPHGRKHDRTRPSPTEASSTDYPIGSAGKPLHSADAGSRRWDNEQFEQDKTISRSSPPPIRESAAKRGCLEIKICKLMDEGGDFHRGCSECERRLRADKANLLAS